MSVSVLEIVHPSLNEGKSCKIFLGLPLPQILQLYLKQTKLARQLLALHAYFLIYNIFSIIDQCRFFYTSGICRYSNPGFCLIFILSKNKNENASFISFHGGIWCRYSEIYKFKRSKDIFPKVTHKTDILKNACFKGNFKYNESLCFTGHSLKQQ